MPATRPSHEFLRRRAHLTAICATRSRGTSPANLKRTMLATRSPLSAAFVLGLLTVASSCGNGGTLDPGMGSSGGGGAGGAQVCGPVCDIFCANGNVLDGNGCPTCSCKPDPPGCPLILLDCAANDCAYGFAADANGCQSCQCAPAPVCDGIAPELCTESLQPVCACDPGLTCARTECGGPPPPVSPAPCEDGSVPPFNCVRNDDRRTCGWHARPCPAVTQ
jgi:Antistasin family